MKKVKFKSLFIFLGLVFVLLFTASCTMPFVGACRDMARIPIEDGGEFGYTEEQSKAACAVANRFLAGKFDKEKKIWIIDYVNILKVEDVLVYVQDNLLSLNQLLSYKDERTVRWLDFFGGFREALEKQEKISRWVEARLKYVINYNQFVDKVGEINSESVKKIMPHGRQTYSLRLLYPQYSLSGLRFVADYVESAKQNGNLVLVNEFPIIEKKKFAEKIIDKDDVAKFKWKEHKRGWLIKAYKILPDKDIPIEPDIDYLEVYKAKFKSVDSREFDSYEEHFVVSGFKSKDSENVNIFVVDYDFDAVVGFSPDEVLQFYSKIIDGDEIYIEASLKAKLLNILYAPPVAEKKEYRRKPPEKPLYVEVVKMGKAGDIKLWEESETGFVIPFTYSGHGPGKFDTDIEVIWKKPETSEGKELLENLKLKQIGYFKMLYKKIGDKVKVVEYYVPKEKYSKRDVKSFFGYSGQITLQCLDQPEEKASLKYFSDKVEAVDYEYGGRWYRIFDEDGNGIYEKRRKIASPNKKKVSYNENGY